jgi:dihydroorotase (multifunctional complex type)
VLIKGATVFIPEGPQPADVLVEDGHIVAVGRNLQGPGPELDANGLWLLPGAIDAHVHSRDPGFPAKEDFSSLTAAAAAGGVTTVADMPNTVPAVDCAAVFQAKVEQVLARARVDFALWGIVRSSSSEAMLQGLWETGAIGIKAYLGYAVRLASREVIPQLGTGEAGLEPPPDYDTLARVAPALAEHQVPLAVHAEDPAILRELARPLHDYEDILAARPGLAEAVAVAALGELAKASQCSIHVVHLSSAAGLRMGKAAQAAGAQLELETCPQYLWCTATDANRLGTVFKMYPPVRTGADRTALREALQQGVIKRVATDHAPHEDTEKLGRGWQEAAAGSPGVETLYLSCLQLGRELNNMAGAVGWVTEGPARALSLYPNKGAICPGADADLVLVDPRGKTDIRFERMHSKQRHGVFEGIRFDFAIRAVWSRGELVAQDGQVLGLPGRGRLVRPTLTR